MVHKELPGEMAKLATGDEAAVLKFARSYGPFGYYALYQLSPEEASNSPSGEPLEWIWAHARSIDLCLKLTQYLQNKDEAHPDAADSPYRNR